MLLRLLLIAASAFYASSSLVPEYEGVGFEEVPKRTLLRGTNETSLEIAHEIYGEWEDALEDFYVASEEEEALDEETDSNVTDSSHRNLVFMTKRDSQWLSSHNSRRKKVKPNQYMPLRLTFC